LKVVVPSPTPNRVETIEKRLEYVDLDTACPVQISHPDGADDPSQGWTEPIGMSITDEPPSVDQDVPS
jgi:hypothetical protein